MIVKKKVGVEEKKEQGLKRKLSAAGGAAGSGVEVGAKESILGNETVGKVP